jgi:F1F0 ATPase subunit 2
MTASVILPLALAFAAGLLLGMVFFGGLWWTVGRALASPQPAVWFLGSMMARMAVLLAGFGLVGRDDWRRWAMCLLGTVLARMMVKRVTRTLPLARDAAAPAARHAP